MKKVYSKQELEQLSEKVFKTYPTAAKVYAREDGNIFLEENHSRLNQGDLKVYPIERPTENVATQDAQDVKKDPENVATQDAQDVKKDPENVATQDAQDVKKDPENVASQDAPDPANINVVDAVVIQKDAAKSGKTNNNQKAKK